MPVSLTIASPRTVRPPKDSAMDFMGVPANFAPTCSRQSTSKLQLAGLNGAVETPACSTIPDQAPSDPSFAQLAPPNARIATS